MAGIVSNDTIVSFKKLTTWGTAVAVTSGFRLQNASFSPGGQFEEFFSRDTGIGKKRTVQVRGAGTFNLSVTCDLTFGQPYLALAAGLFGTESSPTETTVSQSDYSRTLDIADATYGSSLIAWSMCFTNEDATGARHVEIPSVKVTNMRVVIPTNGVGTVTFDCVVDNFVHTGWVSSYANVTGVAATSNYELAIYNGANSYFRMNAQSGAGLTGTDNKQIEELEFNFSRPVEPQWVSRGSSSQYIIEPKELGQLQATLRVRFGEINETNQNLLDMWKNKTTQKAEIFYDGAQIGSGVNTSHKWQFPLLTAKTPFPAGYGWGSNAQLMKPEITFECMKASAAPTGMTGVTDLVRLTTIDRRSTKWTA